MELWLGAEHELKRAKLAARPKLTRLPLLPFGQSNRDRSRALFTNSNELCISPKRTGYSRWLAEQQVLQDLVHRRRAANGRQCGTTAGADATSLEQQLNQTLASSPAGVANPRGRR